MTDTVSAPSVETGQGVAMMDGGAFVPRSELEARFEAINLRIGNVERTTATMAQAQTKLQETQDAIAIKFDANTEKLDAILGFLAHANTWVGFLKKHGPKAGYLFLGIAVSRGWITAENGKNFLHVFTG